MNIRFLLLLAFSLFLALSCKEKPKSPGAENKTAVKPVGSFKIEVYDTSAHSLPDTNAAVEIIAEGFRWSEGPLWVDDLNSLIFSDVPANKIYLWNEQDSLRVYLEHSGYSGKPQRGSGKGSNGLILDRENNLLLCQHGDRRIARMDAVLKKPQGKFTTIAGSYDGKKFNSPNDLVMDTAGNIYFTDPPYGQAGNMTGEIGINGVYRVSPEKKVSLLVDSLSWPNGIGLSLDQKTLYINQSDKEKPVLYSYAIMEDGSLEDGKTLFDFSEFGKKYRGLPDGLKVHKSGNIFATGPGGVHVISPEGKHLAMIKTGKATANCAFDQGHNYLYTTTTDLLLRIKLK